MEVSLILDLINRIFKKPKLILADVLLLNLSLLLSFILRFDDRWLSRFTPAYLLIISIIGLLTLYFLGLYNKMWRYASIAELKIIIKAIVLTNVFFAFVLVFLQIRNFSRSVIIINSLLEIIFLGGIRFSLRLFNNHRRQNKTQNDDLAADKVLIVGANDIAEMIIREIDKNPQCGKEVIGLADNDPKRVDLEIHGKKVLGLWGDISDIIKEYEVSEVIIALPSLPGEKIEEIYDLSKGPEITVNIVPGIEEIINGQFNLNQIREVRVEDLLGREQVDLDIDQIASQLKDKVVLVTGGGGSIGSELCRQIANFAPQKLIIFDISENNTYFIELELKKEHPNLDFYPIIGNVQDKARVEEIFAQYQPDVVFHAAAHKHVPLMEYNPQEAVKNNIFGTKNVIEVTDKYEAERFVFVSTDKAVNPTNVMGATKRIAEMLVQINHQQSQTKFMAVRFGNVLGSKGSVIPLFKEQIAEGGPVTVTHKEVERYFMTIPEAAQLVIQASALGDGGEVFVLDMGEPVKIIDLAKDLIKLSGLEVGKDIGIEIIGLRPGEKLYEELLHDHENDISTSHERIFITNLNTIDKNRLYHQLDDLQSSCQDSNHDLIIERLMSIVKTYQPNRENINTIPS